MDRVVCNLLKIIYTMSDYEFLFIYELKIRIIVIMFNLLLLLLRMIYSPPVIYPSESALNSAFNAALGPSEFSLLENIFSTINTII